MAPPDDDRPPPSTLDDFGLAPGDPVRFRRRADRRWKVAVVTGCERDGSVRLRDPDGASRSLRPEHIEVRVTNDRGRATWVPLPRHAAAPRSASLF